MEPELIVWFGGYLARILSPDRVRVRIYEVPQDPADERVKALTPHRSVRPAKKMRRTAYHVYVNSRPLTRCFFDARTRLDEIPVTLLGPYFAGRFDGDGSWGSTPRIAYTTHQEAQVDRRLLARAGVKHTSALHSRQAREYCVYLHRRDLDAFKGLIGGYSWKVVGSPCRDCNGTAPGLRPKSTGGATRRPRSLTDRVKV